MSSSKLNLNCTYGLLFIIFFKVALGQIYSGTHSYLENIAPRNGVETTWLENGTIEEFEKAIHPNTKVQINEAFSEVLSLKEHQANLIFERLITSFWLRFYNGGPWENVDLFWSNKNKETFVLNLILHGCILYLEDRTYIWLFPVRHVPNFQQCTLLGPIPFWKTCEYQTHTFFLDQLQHSLALSNIKYNCAVIFSRQVHSDLYITFYTLRKNAYPLNFYKSFPTSSAADRRISFEPQNVGSRPWAIRKTGSRKGHHDYGGFNLCTAEYPTTH